MRSIPDYLPNAHKHLDDMERYARNSICRHRALVQYFGKIRTRNCAACDICLGDAEAVPDGIVSLRRFCPAFTVSNSDLASTT